LSRTIGAAVAQSQVLSTPSIQLVIGQGIKKLGTDHLAGFGAGQQLRKVRLGSVKRNRVVHGNLTLVIYLVEQF
jgi:hypothetical protein